MLSSNITQSRKANACAGSPLHLIGVMLLVLCSSLVAHSQAVKKRYSANSMIKSNSTSKSPTADWWLYSSYDGNLKILVGDGGTKWGNPVKAVVVGGVTVARFELHRRNSRDPLRRTFLGTALRSNLAFPLLSGTATEFEARIKFNPIRASGGVVPGFFAYQDDGYGQQRNEIDFEFLHKNYAAANKPAYLPKGALWINSWRNGRDFDAFQDAQDNDPNAVEIFGNHTQALGGWNPSRWNNYVMRRKANSVEWLWRSSPTGQLQHIFTASDSGSPRYPVPDPSKALEVMLNIWNPGTGNWVQANDPTFTAGSFNSPDEVRSYDVQWVEVRGSRGRRVRGKK